MYMKAHIGLYTWALVGVKVARGGSVPVSRVQPQGFNSLTRLNIISNTWANLISDHWRA